MIVVCDTASEAELTAANLLKDTFFEINGTQIDIITDTTAKAETVLNIDKDTIEEFDTLWENAINEAQTDWQKENVRRSEICWRYWKANKKKGEFSVLKGNRIEENERLYNDMVDFGISTLMIGNARHSGKLTENPDFKAVPAEWVVSK